MKIIADFHIHSKYSRATSREMEVETLALWAEKKGIDLLGTGDFTHPQYFAELQGKLEPLGNGLFKLRAGSSPVRFILTVEVSNIFSVKGVTKRIHAVIFAPSFDVAEKINSQLSRVGKLASDGRPIFGLHVKDIVKIALDASSDCLVVPAHAWTPWFSLYGANSGFDSMEECFEEQAKNIYAIETGLSSDPAMNWRLSTLDKITLLSNSDSHSPSRIGREANVFDSEMNYFEIVKAIREKDRKKTLYTIEFFPEEGKYHFDGHRLCNTVLAPQESRKLDKRCPQCGKKLTIGVLHRVDDLADREEGFVPKDAIPFKNMIPLDEIIADAMGQNVGTKGVDQEYEKMIKRIGPELSILFDRSAEELAKGALPQVVEGIMRVREGQVEILPGYDGVYGKIKIFKEEDRSKTVPASPSSQMELF
ncbi:MAG: DNA helicase UvrD [Candidatus Omnitrophica bacterium]|nr:DNA helicase UvrD [Candidatus Omnitrophota bacterium]